MGPWICKVYLLKTVALSKTKRIGYQYICSVFHNRCLLSFWRDGVLPLPIPPLWCTAPPPSHPSGIATLELYKQCSHTRELKLLTMEMHQKFPLGGKKFHSSPRKENIVKTSIGIFPVFFSFKGNITRKYEDLHFLSSL